MTDNIRQGEGGWEINFSEGTTTISRSNFKVIKYEHKHFEKIPLPHSKEVRRSWVENKNNG